MLEMLCREPEQQLLSLGLIVNSSLPPRVLPTLEHPDIRQCRRHWHDDIRVENSLWLELLHPFASVKDLVLDDQLAQLIVPALQELIGERVTQVSVTALENLLLRPSARSGPFQDVIALFFAARRLSGHPLAVLYEDRMH